jgi:hypothetical protein
LLNLESVIPYLTKPDMKFTYYKIKSANIMYKFI